MKSIERLKAYWAQDPANDQLACDLADALFEVGEFQQARQVLRELPADAGAAVGVRFRLSRLELVAGDYAAAEILLIGLSTEGHRSAAIGHDIAFSRLCQRRTSEARATVDETIESFGASPELCVLAARIALMDEDYPRAQASLSQALALEPGHPVAWGLQALALLDAGEIDEAARIAQACLSVHPDQHEALLAAGTIALWARSVDVAEAHFQHALARFPNSGRALSGLGQVLMLRGQLDRAMPQLQHAVMAMPEHIGTWHALAWVQLLQGDLVGAENSYQSAYALDRNFAESHGGLAIVALLDGRNEEGEASMRRALKLDSKCVSGRYAKSLWLENQGDSETAEKLLADVMGEGSLPGATPEQARSLSQGIRNRVLRPH